MTRNKLRFGVLGVGRIGKIHIENLVNRIPGAEVVAISDVAADELAEIVAKYGVERTFAITATCWTFPKSTRSSSAAPPTGTSR